MDIVPSLLAFLQNIGGQRHLLRCFKTAGHLYIYFHMSSVLAVPV